MRIERRRRPVATTLARRGALGALLWAGAPTVSTAQVTIPAESQIVHLDVIVTTRGGDLVRDLTLRDFVLEEDGRTVPITAFQAPAAARATDSAASPRQRPVRPESRAPAEPSDVATLVVYVDNANLTFAGRRRLLSGLGSFLGAQLTGGRARVLVLSEDRGLRILTGLTTSGAELARALVAAERAFPGGELVVQAERTTLDAVRSTIETLPCGLGSACRCLLPLLQNVVRSHAAEREQQLRTTLARLAEAAAILATLPGPKTLFYLSDGLDQRPGAHLFHQLGDICPEAYETDFQALLSPLQEYDISRALIDFAARANAARLTIYPLDGAGLQPASLVDVSRASRRYTPSPKTDAMRRANREAGEWILGEQTGGYPILNTNNPTRALAGVMDELSARYVLGFAPDRVPDRRLHRIRVELRRKGLRVRHRPTYYHGEKAEEVVAKTLASLVAGIEEDALGALVAASPDASAAAQAKERRQLNVRISVPLERLERAPGTREGRGRLRIVIAVRCDEPETGSVHEIREEWVDVPLPEPRPDAGQTVLRHDIVVALFVSGGAGEVAVGLQDVISGLGTFRRVRFEASAPP